MPESSEPLRILIIEDEPIIALDLQDTLVEAGFTVVGVAGRLENALEFIADTVFDAAIVDANLGGISASPAALALAARGLPFIVLSGYSLGQQQDEFAGAPFLQKPCRPAHIVQALREIVVQSQ
jgi:CheY-like chemotaxis protein